MDRLLQERIAQYEDAKAAFLSRWSEEVPCVTKYILGIEYWVRGSIEWMFETNRKISAKVTIVSALANMTTGYFGPQTPQVEATNEVDTSLLKKWVEQNNK